MKISGFTIGKNISKLYYPMKESIMSILPVVDEFIVVLGDSDPDDTTREEIQSIGSDKIKIIDSVWDTVKYHSGTIYAQQTHLAKEHCTGDWLFYIQADEVVHEKYLPVIRERCRELLNEREIEGLLFNYTHFWGDYWHYHDSHGWYRHEIRIIRNDPEIIPWRDAQSFRRIPGFDGKSYLQKANTHKLKVADIDAWIYHYGWVRPPRYMKSKSIVFNSHYKEKKQADLPDGNSWTVCHLTMEFWAHFRYSGEVTREFSGIKLHNLTGKTICSIQGKEIVTGPRTNMKNSGTDLYPLLRNTCFLAVR
jgi:hypothetical protein